MGQQLFTGTGTNLLCIAIPGPADGPVILEMAPAATLFGTISTKAVGKQLPPGVAVDAAGKPTTDPDDSIYKGAGLSLMTELLTQAISHGVLGPGV